MAINISITDAAYKVLLREKRENWNITKLDLKKLNKITLKKLEGI